jgi:hypothetical protein
MQQIQTFQHPKTKFKVSYFDSDTKIIIQSEVEARNEAHAGKLFKKLHSLSVCACKFRIFEVK